MFAADARARYASAVREAELWHAGVWTPQIPQTLSQAHSALVNLKTTALVYLFGPSPMVPEAFVITLNVTIVIAVYLICRHIGATRKSTVAAVLLTAFLPSLIFWSTQDLKDPVTAACIAWAVLALLKVGERAHGGYLLLLIAANLVAIVYRPYVGILLVVGQGLAWAATVKLPQTYIGRLTQIVMFAIMAPIVIHIGMQEMRATYGEQMGLRWAVESYMTFRERAVRGGSVKGSDYAIPLEASSPTEAVLQLPIRVALLIFSPIPLFPGTLRRMLTYPQMWFIYLFVVPRFVRGIWEIWQKNRPALLSLLLLIVPIVIAYALKTALSGEAMRMRIQFIPILLIFAGIGHGVIARNRPKKDAEPSVLSRVRKNS